MTYIKIKTQKNESANMQFLLKLLLLALLAVLVVGINLYLYKMNHLPNNALSDIIPAQAKQLLANYM